MFGPDATMARNQPQHGLLSAYLIAGIRLVRAEQVNARVVPTGNAIKESEGAGP
jgi:hypothetical protein